MAVDMSQVVEKLVYIAQGGQVSWDPGAGVTLALKPSRTNFHGVMNLNGCFGPVGFSAHQGKADRGNLPLIFKTGSGKTLEMYNYIPNSGAGTAGYYLLQAAIVPAALGDFEPTRTDYYIAANATENIYPPAGKAWLDFGFWNMGSGYNCSLKPIVNQVLQTEVTQVNAGGYWMYPNLTLTNNLAIQIMNYDSSSALSARLRYYQITDNTYQFRSACGSSTVAAGATVDIRPPVGELWKWGKGLGPGSGVLTYRMYDFVAAQQAVSDIDGPPTGAFLSNRYGMRVTNSGGASTLAYWSAYKFI